MLIVEYTVIIKFIFHFGYFIGPFDSFHDPFTLDLIINN